LFVRPAGIALGGCGKLTIFGQKLKKSVKVILTIVVVLFIALAALGFYIKKVLPRVGLIPDLKVEVTPGRVERGRYLANSVAVCIVCHSGRDEGLYAAPVKAGTEGAGGGVFSREEGFPGNIYVSNITPNGVGRWTDAELFRAITSGVSKDGHALFPLMNYPAYGQLDQEDIFSIIAYLRVLPAISNDVPATQLDFPVNFIVNTIPSVPALAPAPDSNNASAYGKYLVTMASCMVCHTKENRGTLVAGMEFGGGRAFPGGEGKIVYSANITPDSATGIGNWTRELFVRKFKQYMDSGYVPKPVAAGELNTPMPWLSYARMREKDLAAIYAYLRTVKPISQDVKKVGQ
jgi:mono/diheme cytochrome c family protein